MGETAGTGDFEAHRRHLTGLAYRMLGSLAEAEDAVQEAWLRWQAVERARVADPRAFLARIVTRLCLDHLKSARVQRELYVGPWLPEPIVDEAALAIESASDYAHDVSVALLLVLERLTPLERAAFLLHDVFDMSFAEIAETLGRGEPACRQLAARARAHVRAARPRFAPAAEDGTRLAEAFRAAARSGDAAALARLLADDAVLYADGGGRQPAARNPIRGADSIARLFAGVLRKDPAAFDWAMRPARINGLTGLILEGPDGALRTMAFEVRGGRIAAIYMVVNPDKLGPRLSRRAGETRP